MAGTINTDVLQTDIISEKTSAAGVTIDGVLIKDGAIVLADAATIEVDTINEATAAAGVTVDSVLLKDGGIRLADAAALAADIISEKVSAAGVTVDGVLLKDGGVTLANATALLTDIISEKVSTAGVTIDSVLLKDGGVTATAPVIAPAGSVGAPSVAVGAADTGFYLLTANKTAFSQDGVAALVIAAEGLNIAAVKPLIAIGTTPVGTVSITEYSTGRDVVTELTLTNFIVGALAGAAAALGVGNIVYAFPAGQHFELTSSFSSIVLTCAGTAVATDTGLGSVIASGAVATLDGTGTFEDRLTGQTINTAAGGGTAVSTIKAATAGIGTGISLNVAASVKNVFLNSAGTWNVDNTGDLTATGTIVLKWTKM